MRVGTSVREGGRSSWAMLANPYHASPDRVSSGHRAPAWRETMGRRGNVLGTQASPSLTQGLSPEVPLPDTHTRRNTGTHRHILMHTETHTRAQSCTCILIQTQRHTETHSHTKTHSLIHAHT